MITPIRGADWNDNGVWKSLHEHSWNPENGLLVETWIGLENGIANANTGLNLLQDQDPSPEINLFASELRFLRAFYRFWQLDLFRQVPNRNENYLDFGAPPQVMNAQEATNWLIKELTEIIPTLNDRSNTPYGRVTKAAAQTLLAKVYLNSGVYTGSEKWTGCIQQCD